MSSRAGMDSYRSATSAVKVKLIRPGVTGSLRSAAMRSLVENLESDREAGQHLAGYVASVRACYKVWIATAIIK